MSAVSFYCKGEIGGNCLNMSASIYEGERLLPAQVSLPPKAKLGGQISDEK
jgi:hypothetical protein